MKLKPFTLVLTAALLAFPLLADDGPYVVIERTYYEQCKNSFDSQCNYLYEQVGALFRGWYSELDLIHSQNNTYIHAIDLARIQISQARSSLDTADPDQLVADTQLQDTINGIIQIEDNIARNNDLIVQWKDELQDAKTDLQNHVIATSNSFPYVVATTNLNIYIIVTNSFESATNNYCCCTNEFEHFLNYFKDVESQVLDQYRATVTNMLNQSLLADQLSKSYWYGASQSPAYYQNINWGAWNTFNAGGSPGLSPNLLWANNIRVNPWNAITYRISGNTGDPVTLQEFFTFSLEGIHDSINEIAIDMRKSWLVLQDAMTNTTFSLATINTKTNEFTQFLSMPGSYLEQAAKVANSRNWFQRIELWLSSIARNTNPVEIEQESVESQEGLKNDVENATNELQTAAIGIKDSFNVLPPLTNTTAALDGAVQSCSRILNSFKSSGGRRSASSPPAEFRLMKSEFISTTFERLGLPENENLPYYIGADVDTPGFEHVQSAITWLHHIFGFIWLCGGLALLVFYARWLSSWVVTLWYRMLGMLVKISKFTWGST